MEKIITNLYFQLILYKIRTQARKLKFVNFIHRKIFVIKTYKVFFNHNPEIDTDASVGQSDSRLAIIFLNTLKQTFVYFKRAQPRGYRQFQICIYFNVPNMVFRPNSFKTDQILTSIAKFCYLQSSEVYQNVITIET